MNQKEQALVTYLSKLSKCLQADQWWSEKFDQDSIEAQNLFNREADLKDKYALARKVLSYYEGGMGGLLDSVPEECTQTNTILFELTTDLLRAYWKELGREWHDYSAFDLIPDGARVRLMPNKVIYQRPDHPATIVPDTEEVAKQVWSILKCEGPDVTNMPSYLIKCIEGGSSWRSARHESLAVIGENKSI